MSAFHIPDQLKRFFQKEKKRPLDSEMQPMVDFIIGDILKRALARGDQQSFLLGLEALKVFSHIESDKK